MTDFTDFELREQTIDFLKQKLHLVTGAMSVHDDFIKHHQKEWNKSNKYRERLVREINRRPKV